MNCNLSEKLTSIVRDTVTPNLTAISFAIMKDGKELAAGAVGTRDGDVRPLVKELNAALSGRGGGKPNFAQGSVAASEAEIRAFFEK